MKSFVSKTPGIFRNHLHSHLDLQITLSTMAGDASLCSVLQSRFWNKKIFPIKDDIVALG